MPRIKLTGENAKLFSKLRKKLFIASAYLAVSFALLVLVSYGQYKINIEGVANMPEAAGIEACIDLDKNLSDTVNFSYYLVDLQPGDSARTYAASPSTTTATNHKMTVKITNSSTTTTGEGDEQTETTIASELNLTYTIRITSNPGRIPFQFLMTYGRDKYISVRQTGTDEYRFYKLTGSGNSETVATEEAKFTLSASNTTGNTSTIFVGWDNTATNAATLTDSAFRKEVEMLEVRAGIVADKNGSTIPTESVLQNTIPTPPPSPSPEPSPEGE